MEQGNIFTRLLRDKGGNTAIIFAISAIPLVLIAGGTIDVVSSYKTKARLQTAVDAAALAAAASHNLTNKERKQAGRKALKLNFALAGKGQGKLKGKGHFKINKKEVRVFAKAQTPTTFLRMIGVNKLDVTAQALVKRDFGNLELALVLDNTYSMTGTKIKTLRKAARRLVKSVFKHDDEKNIKIAITPFTRYVRLDLKYKTAPWMEPPYEYSASYPKKCTTKPEYESYNCHTVYGTSFLDGIMNSWHYKACDHKPTGKMITSCSKAYTVNYKWKGCVGSRAYPLNTKDESYSSDKIIPLVDVNECPQQVMPLTDKDGESGLLNLINHMKPRDSQTYIPAGLMWGWRTLSKIAPFDEGKDYSPDNRKALVLMTDGANTVIASGHVHNHGPSYPKAPEADTLTAEICDHIKAKGIRLYTVAFEVTDPATKNMLETCATSSGDFYDASDETKLLAAFENISNSLQTVFLAR